MFDLMVIQEPQYKASLKILVVQKQVAGQDIYSISKSAQYLTKILKEGVYSDSFFEKVDVDGFSEQAKQRRKEWQKDVKVTIIRDLGVMEIDVFHSQKEKALQISQAITEVLEKNHNFYHGGGQNVELKVLDNPLVNQKPNTINLWLGTLLGALFGFFISLVLIFRKKESIEQVFNREASSLDRSDHSI